MSTPKEIEIKFELSPATLPRLKKIPLLRAPKGATRRSAEVSVYFDTDKHKLRKKGVMLRVRRIGNRYIQTIKATGKSGLFERDEWENGIASAQPDLELARGTALEALVARKLHRRLKPDGRDAGRAHGLSPAQQHGRDRVHRRPWHDRRRRSLSAAV